MQLAQFDFKVKHRAGKLHSNADGLTQARKPVHTEEALHLDMVVEALHDLLDAPDPLTISSLCDLTDDELSMHVGLIGPRQQLLEA